MLFNQLYLCSLFYFWVGFSERERRCVSEGKDKKSSQFSNIFLTQIKVLVSFTFLLLILNLLIR